MYKSDLDEYKELRLLESKTDLLFYAIEIFSTELRIVGQTSRADKLPAGAGLSGCNVNKIEGYPCGCICVKALI